MTVRFPVPTDVVIGGGLRFEQNRLTKSGYLLHISQRAKFPLPSAMFHFEIIPLYFSKSNFGSTELDLAFPAVVIVVVDDVGDDESRSVDSFCVNDETLDSILDDLELVQLEPVKFCSDSIAFSAASLSKETKKSKISFVQFYV